VILDVPAIASRLAPELLGDAAGLAAICIRTTNPKFLLFRGESRFPTCVAQVGSRPELERTDVVLARIHAAAPGLAARPLGLAPLEGDRCVHLQSGMPGLPWFVINDRIRTRPQWEQVVAQSVSALKKLQNAIGAYADWRVTLRPGQELRRQASICVQNGNALSERARRCIDEQAAVLDSLGEIPSQYQHGDFCLNNLLIGEREAAVIDFDEFGRTAMPLHDEIGLALSVADLCRFPDLSQFPRHDQFRGLYLHHLIWRINQANPWPTRTRMRLQLLEKVERSTANAT
jgi:phosphotransferase family enzyme